MIDIGKMFEQSKIKIVLLYLVTLIIMVFLSSLENQLFSFFLTPIGFIFLLVVTFKILFKNLTPSYPRWIRYSLIGAVLGFFGYLFLLAFGIFFTSGFTGDTPFEFFMDSLFSGKVPILLLTLQLLAVIFISAIIANLIGFFIELLKNKLGGKRTIQLFVALIVIFLRLETESWIPILGGVALIYLIELISGIRSQRNK